MIAVVFPGQGSQSVGMLQAWAEQEPLVLHTFAEASEQLNYDLWELVQAGPEEKLNQTEHTQPALLTASVALYRVLKHRLPSLKPYYLAGHSLGEYSALVCSDALAFKDAVKLVEMRGRFMQMAVPVGQGAMAAIVGLTASQVEALCKDVSTDTLFVTPANYNADMQTVIAGEAPAVEAAIAVALEQGAKLAKKLAMSVPSHCAMMKPAAIELEKYLNEITIKTPNIPVIHNVDVAEHSASEAIKKALVEQLYQPVRWTETIKAMEQFGVRTLIECGPDKVLAGLCKRIASSPEIALTMSTPDEFEKVLSEANHDA